MIANLRSTIAHKLKWNQPTYSLKVCHLYMHFKKNNGVLSSWQVKVYSLLAFNMILCFFLSCRRFSVTLNPVGVLGNGYLELYTVRTVLLLGGPSPGSGSLETRDRAKHRFVS